MVKRGGIVRQYPAQREAEKPEYPGQKPQYKPGFGPQGKSQPKPASNLLVIIAAIILIIVFIIVLVSYFKSLSSIPKDIGNSEDGGSNDCTCYCDDGTVCTSNSQCPPETSVPGTYVPGVCGCPVDC